MNSTGSSHDEAVAILSQIGSTKLAKIVLALGADLEEAEETFVVPLVRNACSNPTCTTPTAAMAKNAYKGGYDCWCAPCVNLRVNLRHRAVRSSEKQTLLLSDTEKCEWTYIMLDTETGNWKIGTSINVSKRLQTLKTGNPSLKLLAKVCGGRDFEKWLHWLARSNRLEGEYFTPTRGILERMVRYGGEVYDL